MRVCIGPSTLAILLSLLTLTQAATLRIVLSPSTLLPNPHSLPPSTHATLTSAVTGAILTAVIRIDNSIVFSQIPTTGTHLLDIYSRDHVFAPYRVDISSGSTSEEGTQLTGVYETYRGTQWSDHGINLISSSQPSESLTFTPKVLGLKSFYESRPGFSPLTLLKNPMILFGGVALLFTLGIPKLLENMDPEMRAEYDEMQKAGPMAGLGKAMSGAGPASQAAEGFDLAGYLAGSGSGGANKATGREAVEGIRERRR